MNFEAIRQHFSHHRLHIAGCGLAALLVVVALAFGVPIVGVVGALICGAMMIGMVWMMVSMGAKHLR
jgi:hypothetical protein